MIMKCDQCGGAMLAGIALNAARTDEQARSLGGPVMPANATNLGFIPVLKCIDCGRSLNEEEARAHLNK